MAGKFAYSRLARTVQRLLDRFGAMEQINGFVDTPNVEQPNRPGTRTPVSANVNAVFTNIEAKHIDGTLIKNGDMVVLISPADMNFDPRLTGTITRQTENEIWSIVPPIKTINPGGLKLLYKIQVRK